MYTTYYEQLLYLTQYHLKIHFFFVRKLQEVSSSLPINKCKKHSRSKQNMPASFPIEELIDAGLAQEKQIQLFYHDKRRGNEAAASPSGWHLRGENHGTAVQFSSSSSQVLSSSHFYHTGCRGHFIPKIRKLQ